MLGADTNVLVRFITKDQAQQSPQSHALIRASGNQPIFICAIVLVELVWVLTKVKKLPQVEVLEICRDLMANAAFKFERADIIARALDEAQAAGCDFADALIVLSNAEAGCESTATFDTDALRLGGMVAVKERL